MLTKCANPACTARFHYFRHGRDGRLFQVERRSNGAGNGAGKNGAAKNGHNIEHFWLCAACAAAFTIAVDAEGRVDVQPQPSSGRKAA
jgi:hypothetical protein